VLVAIPLLLNRAGCLVADTFSSGAAAAGGVVAGAVVDAVFFAVAVSEM
jgi:hypothetical protein